MTKTLSSLRISSASAWLSASRIRITGTPASRRI
jgi:hypothetical protein